MVHDLLVELPDRLCRSFQRLPVLRKCLLLHMLRHIRQHGIQPDYDRSLRFLIFSTSLLIIVLFLLNLIMMSLLIKPARRQNQLLNMKVLPHLFSEFPALKQHQSGQEQQAEARSQKTRKL